MLKLPGTVSRWRWPGCGWPPLPGRMLVYTVTSTPCCSHLAFHISAPKPLLKYWNQTYRQATTAWDKPRLFHPSKCPDFLLLWGPLQKASSTRNPHSLLCPPSRLAEHFMRPIFPVSANFDRVTFPFSTATTTVAVGSVLLPRADSTPGSSGKLLQYLTW